MYKAQGFSPDHYTQRGAGLGRETTRGLRWRSRGNDREVGQNAESSRREAGHVEVLLTGEKLLNKFQQVGPATAGLANSGLK